MDLILEDGTTERYFTPVEDDVGLVSQLEHVDGDEIIRVSNALDDDDAHIFLQGNLIQGDYFIRAKNPTIDATDVFYVSYDGTLHCRTITSSTITNLESYIEDVGELYNDQSIEITTLNDIVLDRTSEATANTLVERDGSGDFSARRINCDILDLEEKTDPAVLRVNKGQIYYIPERTLSSGEVYRFGMNHEEFDASGAGDGLEFKENNCSILMQCQESAPVIDITCAHTTAPYFRVQKDGDSVPIFEIQHDRVVSHHWNGQAMYLTAPDPSEWPVVHIAGGRFHYAKNSDVFLLGEDVDESTNGLFLDSASGSIRLQSSNMLKPQLLIENKSTGQWYESISYNDGTLVHTHTDSDFIMSHTRPAEQPYLTCRLEEADGTMTHKTWITRDGVLNTKLVNSPQLSIIDKYMLPSTATVELLFNAEAVAPKLELKHNTTTNFSVDLTGDMDCRDVICRHLLCTDSSFFVHNNGAQIFSVTPASTTAQDVICNSLVIKDASDNDAFFVGTAGELECETVTCEEVRINLTDGNHAFRIFNQNSDRVFSVDTDGRIRSAFENDNLNAFDDDSVFIGSAKHSYKRSVHLPSIKRLKQNNIPKYLVDLGVTLSNYGTWTSFNIDNLTVKRWVKLAENKTGLELSPSDVFPKENDSDDFEGTMFKEVQAEFDSVEADITGIKTKTDLVTATEVGYLSNVTSDIQAQLDASGGMSNPFLFETTDQTAVFQLRSSHASGGAEFSLFVQDQTSGQDHNDTDFKFRAPDSRKIDFLCHQQFDHSSSFQNVEYPFFSANKWGNMIFYGKGQTAGDYYHESPNQLFLGSIRYDHTDHEYTALPTSEPNTDNRLWVENGNLKLSGDYSAQTLIFDGTQGNVGAASNTANWYQLPQSHALTIFTGGVGGYPQLYSYKFVLPLPHDDIIGATIEVNHMSAASSYSAFSQMSNGGPLGNSYVQVVDASGAHGGVAGNMSVSVSGDVGFAKFVLLKSSSAFYWTCTTGGEWVATSTL